MKKSNQALPEPKPYFKDAEGKIISRFWNEKEQRFLPILEKKLTPYIPSDDIIELVKLAQILKRPILIRGEPGSGKTQLARSVAFEWYGDDYKDHYFEWHIKSHSKATDGIYAFDHISRLRDAQFKRMETEIEDIRNYRSFGPFAQALQASTPETPAILLIDEIDKADVDFPNDLLLELDENRFFIPETNESIEAIHPPIVFITSNDEREMPQAFLRRCLFMWIDFPKDEVLTRIVQAHMPWFAEKHQGFIDKAIEVFNIVRDNLKKNVAETKNVSTSELLNWLAGFNYEAAKKEQTNDDLKKLMTDKENGLRFYPALFKTYLSYNQRKDLPKAPEAKR